MTRQSSFALAVGLAVLGLILIAPWFGLAAEKMRFGTSLKTSPRYALPAMAAEEKGFWTQQGLEVEWLPFAGGGDLYRGMAAGSVDMGFTQPIALVTAASAGVPVLIVAPTLPKEDFFLYVPQASPIKEVKELKGAKIGINRLGGAAYAYARLTARVLAMEKDLAFVATGGITESIAALRAGRIDGVLSDIFSMGALVGKKEIRPIVAVGDYVPTPWLGPIIVASKDMTGKRAEAVKRAVRAFFQATAFIEKDRTWAIDKMKSVAGYSEEGALAIYPELRYGAEARIEKAAVENVRNFMIEFGLVAKDKARAADELFTNDFVR